jgi:hypothetical protein
MTRIDIVPAFEVGIERKKRRVSIIRQGFNAGQAAGDFSVNLACNPNILTPS